MPEGSKKCSISDICIIYRYLWKPRPTLIPVTFNQWVAGSNPARLTNHIKGLERIGRRRSVMGRAQGTLLCDEGCDCRSLVQKRVRSSEDKVRHIRLGTSPCLTQRREPGDRQAVTGTRSRSASFLPMRDIQYPSAAAFAPCSSM